MRSFSWHYYVMTQQGCQIFIDTKYQNRRKYTKLSLNYRMAMECINFLFAKGLQNFPKLGFFV
jgi:hypothetical protein